MGCRWTSWPLVLVLAVGLAACGSSPATDTGPADTPPADPGSDADIPLADLADVPPADLPRDPAGEAGPDVPADPGADVPPIPCTTTAQCEGLLDGPAPGPCLRPWCDTDAGTCAWTPAPNGVECDDGDPCTVDTRCASGECLGRAVDCDDGNPCTADRCDAAGLCAHDPAEGACDDDNPCTPTDQCQDGACVGTGNTCACQGDGECAGKDDGDLCNGTLHCVEGFCVVDPGTVVSCEAPASPCLAAECDAATGNCTTKPAREGAACDDGSVCTQGDRCAAGACLGTGTLPCDDLNACTDDTCDPVAGCRFTPNTAACDDGNGCTVDDACRDGTCQGRATVDCGCTVDGDCAAQEDGDRCNGTLRCVDGFCAVDPVTVVTCDPLAFGPCKVAACNPASGQCEASNLAEERPCDDGDACTPQSACKEGVCAPVGDPLSCDDGQSCTQDSCNPASGCVHDNLPGSCDDGNACTVGEQCLEGRCQGGTARTCTDASPCTDNVCDPLLGCLYPFNTAGCDDGDACTVGDACSQGRCVPGPRNPCDDANPCTDDRCNQDLGGCVHDANTASCEDGDFCTAGDACAAKACVPGGPRDCDDGNPCTRDECRSDLKACTHAGLDLSDGLGCTDDACDPATGQISHTDNCPQDNDLCTTQYCSATAGSCVTDHTPVDDGDPCTVDACNPLTGLVTHVAVVCADADLCDGTETCDPATGNCLPGTPKDCSDGDACTGVETCVPATGACLPGTPVVCADADLCDGTETCDPATGGCLPGTPKDCSDGDACTGVETCEPATGACLPGTPLTCADDLECTRDACDPALGCTFTPRTGSCDDENLCTTGDECQEDGTCQGVATVCSDGDFCNGVETCDPDTGTCVDGTPVVCDDQDVCNGLEACVRDTGTCLPGIPLDCGDDNPCTDNECLPLTGCRITNNARPCNDQKACTTGDTCAEGQCSPSGPTNCDDGLDCTTDSCEEPGGCRHVPHVERCDDGNACTTDACDLTLGCTHTKLNGVGCNDGSVCTQNDICVAGTCIGTNLITCNDGVACTDDTCDAQAGCVYTPNPAQWCNDRNPCTDDLCDPSAGGCQHPFNRAPCDDNDPCTVGDACLEGSCASGVQDTCDDGVACTIDYCDSAVGCRHIPYDGLCDDGNPCTDGVCDAERGCQQQPNVAPCDDSDPCTRVDTCDQGNCVGSSIDPCDDLVACTADECVPFQGCAHRPDDSVCADAFACTWDYCRVDAGCVHDPQPILCDDGNRCTMDACDVEAGCAYTKLTGDTCDDSNLCTRGDTCVDGTCTGSAIECADDGIACTAELCEPSFGCYSLPDDGACNDGQACTTDRCTDGGCAYDVNPSACSDGVACTVDLCEPFEGCSHQVDDLACDDFTNCTTDACDPVAGCRNQPIAGYCDDGIACTREECASGTDCLIVAEDGACNDGVACTMDYCVAGGGSQAPGCHNDPVDSLCEDGNACTANACAPAGCLPAAESCCTNGSDDDGDGRIDCWDSDCGADPACHFSKDLIWCRLQWPTAILSPEGTANDVFSRVYVAGITTASGVTDPFGSLRAEVGVGPDGTDPSQGAAGWTWTTAGPNTGYGPGSPLYEANNDEYLATIPTAAWPGPWDYAARYSGDNGATWVYCDLNAGAGSDGSQDGYQAGNAGAMTPQLIIPVTGTDHEYPVRGAPLTVQGSRFTGADSVKLGGVPQPFAVLSDTEIAILAVDAATPTGAQDLAVSVAGSTGVLTGLKVLGLARDRSVVAHGGTLGVTVEGADPAGAVAVTVGGVAQPWTVAPPATMTVGPVTDGVAVGPAATLQIAWADGESVPVALTVIHLVIHELDADQTGADTLEYIELSTGVPGVSLAGHALVLYNGSNDLSYLAWDLTGSADANGLYLLGSANVLPAPQQVVTNATGGATDIVQNGQDAVALYQGAAASFPLNTPVNATGLLDALVYDTADADDPGLLAVLLGAGPEAVQVDEFNGLGSTAGTANTIQRCGPARRDGRVFAGTVPATPGVANFCP